jgi:hypothetical protein
MKGEKISGFASQTGASRWPNGNPRINCLVFSHLKPIVPMGLRLYQHMGAIFDRYFA